MTFIIKAFSESLSKTFKIIVIGDLKKNNKLELELL